MRDAKLRRHIPTAYIIRTARLVWYVQRREDVADVLLKIPVFWGMKLCLYLSGLIDPDYEDIRIFRNVGKH